MKKVVSLFVVIIMMVSLIAACGGNSSNNSGGSTNPGTTNNNSGKETGGEEIIELTYWDGTWAEDITPQLIAEFNEQHPNIKINVEYFPWDGMQDKYLIALRNDNGPDIINLAVDWTVPFAAMGKLQSLDEYIEKYDVDMSDFYEGPLQTLTYNDSYYALPYRSETHALYYNKAMFAAAGLDGPPATWDELVEYSQKIKEATGNDGFGQVGSEFGNLTSQLFNLVMSNGGSVLNEDHTASALSEPEAIEAAQLFVDMYRTYGVSPRSTMENDNTDNRNLFANEKIAMFISGNYDIAALEEANPDLDFGTALLPEMSSGRKTILGGWSVGVTNTAADAEAAFKFVDFLASPEVSPRYSITFSSRASQADHEKYQTEKLQPFVEALNYAQAMPPIPQLTQIKQIVYNQLQGAMIGDKSVEEAMNEATKQINEVLAGN